MSRGRRRRSSASDEAALGLRRALRATAIGAAAGTVAGASSAAFLRSLDAVTDLRLGHPWLLWTLPLCGLVVGLAYQRGAGRAAGGTGLVLDELHEPTGYLPRRLAPLVLFGTLVTHLGGGSAGREGTALQMSAGLVDGVVSRLLRLGPADRRTGLVAAIGGGFGAVFGVPVAGAVFAVEVPSVSRLDHRSLLPALVASATGDLVARGLGARHDVLPAVVAPTDAGALARFALAGVAFGLCARGFTAAGRLVAGTFARIRWVPLRPVVGGVLLVGATLVLGERTYNGLSTPLAAAALAGGAGVAWWAFAAKLGWTALTLGSGFQGGEVTPLFVIGAALGVPLAHALGLPVAAVAATGFVAVFGAAANTPVACSVMAVELFGAGVAVPAALVVLVAWAASGRSGIYRAQR